MSILFIVKVKILVVLKKWIYRSPTLMVILEPRMVIVLRVRKPIMVTSFN